MLSAQSETGRKAMLLQWARRPGSGSGDPVGKLQNVVGENGIPCSVSGRSDVKSGFASAFPRTVRGGNLTHIVLGFTNASWRKDGYTLPIAGHDILYRRVAIAAYSATSAVGSDTYAAVTFSGGESITLVRGDIDRHSDVLSVQAAFGIPYFEPGDIIWIRYDEYTANSLVEPIASDVSVCSNTRAVWSTEQGIGTSTNLCYGYDHGSRIAGAGVYGTQTMTINQFAEQPLTGPNAGIQLDPAAVPMVLGYFAGGVEPVSILALGGASMTKTNQLEGQSWCYGGMAAQTALLPYMQLGIHQDAVSTELDGSVAANDLLWLTTFGPYCNTLMLAIGEDLGSPQPAEKAAANRSILETARTTVGMKTIVQSVMPFSTGSWTTDPPGNQAITGTAGPVAADTMDAHMDSHYALNLADHMVHLDLLTHATTGDDARRWGIVTRGGTGAPLTGAAGPAATPAGRVPLSDGVHTNHIAPSVATVFSAVTVGPALDRYTYVDCSAVTTAFTPEIRSNMAVTAYFILIPSADIAAFDALPNSDQVVRIKAGKQSDNSTAATNVQSKALAAGVSTKFTPITGLAQNTGFKGYWCATDSRVRNSTAHGYAITTSNGAAVIDASGSASTDAGSSLTTGLITPTGGSAAWVVAIFRPATQTLSTLTSTCGMTLAGGGFEFVDDYTIGSRIIAVYQTTAAPTIPGPATFTATFSASTRAAMFVMSVKYGNVADPVRLPWVEAFGTYTSPATTPPTVTVSDAVSTDMLVGLLSYAFGGGAADPGAGETELFNFQAAAGNSNAAFSQPGATAGGVIAPTLAASAAWTIVGMALQGAA